MASRISNSNGGVALNGESEFGSYGLGKGREKIIIDTDPGIGKWVLFRFGSTFP